MEPIRDILDGSRIQIEWYMTYDVLTEISREDTFFQEHADSQPI